MNVPKGRPTAPPAVTQDFLFVDSSKSAKSSRQGRRNARSFVMQKARRERPWSTSKHGAKQSNARRSPGAASSSSAGTPDLCHTPYTSTPSPPRLPSGGDYLPLSDNSGFPIGKQTFCQDCQIFSCRPGQTLCPRCILLQPTAPPPEDIDGSLIDPFGTCAVEIDPHVSELLGHFMTEMAPGSVAVDFRHKSDLVRYHWFGTAMSSPGFMHSLLCTIGVHMYVMGKGSFSDLIEHKTKAIAAVNAAISNPNREAGISDANIGAVFNLLCVEESLTMPIFPREISDEEQPNQRMIHLEGLRKMVELRGGLRNMNSNRCLQAFILWHSTAHAIASFQAPYLSTSDYISAASLPHHPPGYYPAYSNHLLDYCRAARVKDSLVALVESALILIADLNVWFDDSNCPLDPVDIQNFSCVLECLLLQWLQDNQGLVMPLEDALCVALLIFTVRTTEALSRRAGVHHLHFVASKRLQKALSATSRQEWLPCPDLLLWILSIGTISAEGSEDQSWFIYQTSLACREFRIDSDMMLLAHLHHCGWVSFKLDEAAHRLWARISNLRPSSHTSINSNNQQDSGHSPSLVAGPLQPQVSEPDFSEWQEVESMGMARQGIMQQPQPLGGEDGLYDLAVTYVLRRNFDHDIIAE